MKTVSLLAAAFAASTQFTGAYAGLQRPKETPVEGQMKSQGCFASGGNLVKQTLDHVSSGNCFQLCEKKGKAVMGLSTTKCFCGDKYPPAEDLLSDSKCNYPCIGYGKEACGALKGIFSIFNTGVEVDVENEEPVKSSTTEAASKPSKTEAGSDTPENSAVASESSSPSDDKKEEKEEKKGPPTAAIAAGVVAGVVVIAAVIGVIVFFVRRRRNAEIEEEHRRNAAVNAFINGSKPPGSSGSISMTDSRLDPVLAHRRLSDGSIADNQDYSRRILRVTNA